MSIVATRIARKLLWQYTHLQPPALSSSCQLNALTGTIPPDICGRDSQLAVLNLHSNRLKGSATAALNCLQLASLDLSSNRLTGSVPATKVRIAASRGSTEEGHSGQQQRGGHYPDRHAAHSALAFFEILNDEPARALQPQHPKQAWPSQCVHVHMPLTLKTNCRIGPRWFQ